MLVLDCDESNYGLHRQLGMELPDSLVDMFGGKDAVFSMQANGPQNMPRLFSEGMELDEIPERYRTVKDGITLMNPGKIEEANEACACPFNVVVAQLIPSLNLTNDDAIFMDMEAGVEHFGRGTDNDSDAILMKIDPSYESMKLSRKVTDIGSQLGVPVYYALNKVTAESEELMVSSVPDRSHIIGIFRNDAGILRAGMIGEEFPSGNPMAVAASERLSALCN